jgi:hypothetical protein
MQLGPYLFFVRAAPCWKPLRSLQKSFEKLLDGFLLTIDEASEGLIGPGFFLACAKVDAP